MGWSALTQSSAQPAPNLNYISPTMQYGYPQWGHGGIQNFNAPSYTTGGYSGWPPPPGFGQQVSWGAGGSWPASVPFQPSRPAPSFQAPSNQVISGLSGQNYVGVSQNNGPYYPQASNSTPSSSRAASASTNQNAGPVHTGPSTSRPAAPQAVAPRREQAPPTGSRPSQSQQQHSSQSSAEVGGQFKAAPRSPHIASASSSEVDNYNTGIKLQEVRIGLDKALKVMKITPGSSAELCGVINVGDRLVKIGDTDVYNSYDTARVRDLLSGPRGSRIWMAFENALRPQFEVELVRNVRSIKRNPSESQQSIAAAPTSSVQSKITNAPSGVQRMGDAQDSKQNPPSSNNRAVQSQPTAQARQQQMGTQQGQRAVNGISQQLGNVQIRSDSGSKAAPAPNQGQSRPAQGQSSTSSTGAVPRQNQGQAPSSQTRPAQATSSNTALQQGGQQQSQQPPSQIVYGPRSVSGPFGQYNSMQYTIIGGSLAGSVVGGSHAGSVVGDSLTPSLVIGDWFGGDYV